MEWTVITAQTRVILTDDPSQYIYLTDSDGNLIASSIPSCNRN